MESNSLDAVLRDATDYLLTTQGADGSFPAGCNGPYGHAETPVRNTAHALCLLALTARPDRTSHPDRTPYPDRYHAAADRAIRYLLEAGPDLRPTGGTYACRLEGGKDRCNGVIGQAWVIEALVEAARAFDRPECYRAAEELFFLHPWDRRVSLWHRVEVDGTVLPPDSTFNHQLWFAAAVSLLRDTPVALDRARTFLRAVAAPVEQYPEGVIFHEAPQGPITGYLAQGPRALVRELKSRRRQHRKHAGLYTKSVGYHAFNLHAFAMLHQTFPGETLWRGEPFRRMLNVCGTKAFQEELSGAAAEYGYRYNVSGIEIAFALEQFSPHAQEGESEAGTWLRRQFRETCLEPALPLAGGAADQPTALARLYEAARLTGDYEVQCG